MATLDWSQCPAVESVPGKRSGAWVFKDTRMPVATVFENLESGASIEEIMEWFGVTREQIVAVLDFAARSLDTPRLPAIRRCPPMRILFDQGMPAPLGLDTPKDYDGKRRENWPCRSTCPLILKH
ncbi:MAG: DUF433 domain-containing protein [Candidatus Sulfotelmatobacter sp.]